MSRLAHNTALRYDLANSPEDVMAEDPAPRTTVCGSCRHYDPKTKDNNDFTHDGRREVAKACRRYPTVVFKDATEWCGKWLTH